MSIFNDFVRGVMLKAKMATFNLYWDDSERKLLFSETFRHYGDTGHSPLDIMMEAIVNSTLKRNDKYILIADIMDEYGGELISFNSKFESLREEEDTDDVGKYLYKRENLEMDYSRLIDEIILFIRKQENKKLIEIENGTEVEMVMNQRQ